MAYCVAILLVSVSIFTACTSGSLNSKNSCNLKWLLGLFPATQNVCKSSLVALVCALKFC